MARLIDVAKAAGVSRSTASNVFNNPDVVRLEVRKQVEEAARKLGYLGPDPKGRLLRAGKFNALAVVPPGQIGVFDAVRNPVFQMLLAGVGDVCDEIGSSLVVVSDKTGGFGIRNALVDGFIFSRVEQVAQFEHAQLRQLPFAVVDFDAGPDVSSVRVDARAGCRVAVEHLLAYGHRRFAILSFLRSTSPARFFPPGQDRPPEAAGTPIDQEKYTGYADGLARAGIDIGQVPMVRADPWDPGAARLLLDAALDATAILSMSVMQAISVLEEARRRGLSVPGDLSVVGFNDIPEAARCNPPLTTVDGMGLQRGRAAARIVIAGNRPVHELLQPDLIVRGSCGPAPR